MVNLLIYLIPFFFVFSNDAFAYNMHLPACIASTRAEVVEHAYNDADKIFYGEAIAASITEQDTRISPHDGTTYEHVTFKVSYRVILSLKGVLPWSKKVELHYQTLRGNYERAAAAKLGSGGRWISAKKFNDGLLREFRGPAFCFPGASDVELISYATIMGPVGVMKYALATILIIGFAWIGILIAKKRQ